MRNSIYTIAQNDLCSCTKLQDFGNTNVDPDAINEPNTAALLTNTLSGLCLDAWSFWGQGFLPTGIYCQYFSESAGIELMLYAPQRISPMGQYAGALKDLQTIINTNSNEATRKEV